MPFQGQKRFFIQQFARQIAQYPSDSTFVDLFGGSGLLSRVCKDIHPSARVLYNDHDHYSDRLALIPQTETIRQRLLPLVAHIPRSKRIDPATAHRICNVEMKDYDISGTPFGGGYVCDQVNEARRNLCSLIEAQAQLYSDFSKRLDAEMARRQTIQ